MERQSWCTTRYTNKAAKTSAIISKKISSQKVGFTIKVTLNRLINIDNAKITFNWFNFVYFHGLSEIP